MQPTPDHAGDTRPGTASTPYPSAAAASSLADSLTLLVEQAQQAFRRDLPDLLQTPARYRHWVAYHGARRIGFGKTKTELYQECLRRGLRPGEFIVRCIEAEVPHEVDLHPDV